MVGKDLYLINYPYSGLQSPGSGRIDRGPSLAGGIGLVSGKLSIQWTTSAGSDRIDSLDI